MVEEAWDRIARFEEISADQAYDMLRHRWSTRMNDVKAAILLSRGDVGGAQALSERGLEVATRWGMKKYIGREERVLGQVMTVRGAHERAENHFRRALQQLEEVGNPKQLWITHAALAKLYHAMERFDREREHWHHACALVRSTADGLQDEHLRETFLAAAPVREILDSAAR